MTKQRLSVREFAAKYEFSEEYVRQMCRQQGDPRSNSTYRLPEGWLAEKAGRDWFLLREEAAPQIRRVQCSDWKSLRHVVGEIHSMAAELPAAGSIHISVKVDHDGAAVVGARSRFEEGKREDRAVFERT